MVQGTRKIRKRVRQGDRTLWEREERTYALKISDSFWRNLTRKGDGPSKETRRFHLREERLVCTVYIDESDGIDYVSVHKSNTEEEITV